MQPKKENSHIVYWFRFICSLRKKNSHIILISFHLQLKKENSHIDILGIPPVRLGENEEVTCEAATTAVKKAVRLNRAIQASDGHWPAENAGPMFFTPPLVGTSSNSLFEINQPKENQMRFINFSFHCLHVAPAAHCPVHQRSDQYSLNIRTQKRIGSLHLQSSSK